MRTCAQVDCRVRNATSGVRGSAYMYWIDMATTHNCVIALAYLLLHHFYHSAFYAQIYLLLFLRLSNINTNFVIFIVDSYTNVGQFFLVYRVLMKTAGRK